MLTVQDIISKYENYSDEELYTVYKSIDNYSDDAKHALDFVLKKKGGFDSLIKRLEEKVIIQNEKRRIGNEATLLGMNGVDAEFLKSKTFSSILTQKEVNEIIETNVDIATLHIEDKKVSSDTIAKSILGCGLASAIGGALVSLQYIYLGATSVIMIIGLALVCYSVVKFTTKKSYNNTAVLLSSFASFMISYLIGYAVFLIVGYLG